MPTIKSFAVAFLIMQDICQGGGHDTHLASVSLSSGSPCRHECYININCGH